MKKLLLLSIIFILTTSCQYFNVQKKKLSYTQFKKNTIEFRENTMMLTEAYRTATPEEFRTIVGALKGDSKFKKVALLELEKIEKKKVDFKLFVDEKNPENNYIFMYACDYFQLNEQRAATVVDALSDEIKDEANIQNVKYQRIHGRFFFTPNSKIVKLKYLKSFKKDRKYLAEYIVASKSGGMGVMISNVENVDFERSIKRLAVK